MKAINLNPVIPVRTAPSEQSEQSTQLLFGELFEAIVENEKWCAVCNATDKYEGFVSKNMVTFISDNDYELLQEIPKTILSKPIAQVRDMGTNEKMFLPMGSFLYQFYDNFFTAHFRISFYRLHRARLSGGQSITFFVRFCPHETGFNLCGIEILLILSAEKAILKP